jgi:hypothetical protein
MMQLPCCLVRSMCQLHGLLAHHLAIAALAVEREQRAVSAFTRAAVLGCSPPSSTAST